MKSRSLKMCNMYVNRKLNFKKADFLPIHLSRSSAWTETNEDVKQNRISLFELTWITWIKKVTNLKTAVQAYQAYKESILRYGLINMGR